MSFYFAIYFEDKNPIGQYPEYGFWNNYFVYEMPTYIIPKLNLQNIRIVPFEDPAVAAAWKFAGNTNDHIKVRDNTLPDKQIPKELRVPYKPAKDKYFLTKDDIDNGVKFMKAIMLDMAHRGFEQEWNITKPAWSKLYKNIPEAQPLLQEYIEHQKSYGERLYKFHKKIESCTTVEECNLTLLELQLELNPDNVTPAEKQAILDVQRSAKSEA